PADPRARSEYSRRAKGTPKPGRSLRDADLNVVPMTDARDLPRIPRKLRSRPVRGVLQVAYDGTGFRGFQRQPDQRTVEGVLVDALRARGLSGGLAFASRTDAGVHARGQVLAFRAPEGDSPGTWAERLAGLLPPDIRIVASAVAPK